MENNYNEIKVSVWWRGGGMMVRRDCLSPDHPEHTYNYMIREFGVRPEEYGIEKPVAESCPECGCEF